jgi:hypothetical protein
MFMLKADHCLSARRPSRADEVLEADKGDMIEGAKERGKVRGGTKSRTYQDQIPDHPFQSFSSLDKMVF